jgi:hypothetical protein
VNFKWMWYRSCYSGDPPVELWFGDEWEDRPLALPRGSRVTVEGQISAVNDQDVVRNDCELE